MNTVVHPEPSLTACEKDITEAKQELSTGAPSGSSIHYYCINTVDDKVQPIMDLQQETKRTQ